MSRCVKNLRREGSAANTGPTATQTGKTGTARTVQSVTKLDGRKPVGPGFTSQTVPGFNGAPVVLSKFDGH